MRQVNPYILGAAEAPPPGESSLNTGIKYVFDLDDPSGNQTDLVQGLTLTRVNNPTVITPGVIDNATDFDGRNGNNYFFNDDETPHRSVDNFTISVWVRYEGPADRNGALISGVSWNPTDWRIAYDNYTSRKFRFGLSPDGSNTLNYAISPTTFSVDTWHHILCGRDDANGIFISVDNESIVYNANHTRHTAGSPVGFGIGIDRQYTAGATWDDGIDNYCRWDRVLTASERTEIYDQGLAGNTYPWPELP